MSEEDKLLPPKVQETLERAGRIKEDAVKEADALYQLAVDAGADPAAAAGYAHRLHGSLIALLMDAGNAAHQMRLEKKA